MSEIEDMISKGTENIQGIMKTLIKHGDPECDLNYNDFSDNMLLFLAEHGYKGAKIKLYFKERYQHDEELANLDMDVFENFVKRFYETFGDSEFLIQAFKDGMGVFVKGPNKYKKQLRTLVEKKCRGALLPRDINEIKEYYENILNNWDNQTIGFIKQLIKVEFESDGKMKKTDSNFSIQEIEKAIKEFIENVLNPILQQDEYGIRFNDRLVCLADSDEINKFINKVMNMKHIDLCNFLLDNKYRFEKERNRLLFQTLVQQIESKYHINLDSTDLSTQEINPGTTDLSTQEINSGTTDSSTPEKDKSAIYRRNQIMMILKYLNTDPFQENNASVVSFKDASRLLWSSDMEQYRRKYYLPRLDYEIYFEWCTKPGYSNSDISSVSDENIKNLPFEIKLRLGNGLQLAPLESIKGYKGEIDSVNSETLIRSWRRILKYSFNKKKDDGIKWIQECKYIEGCKGREWMRDALYEEVLDRLLSVEKAEKTMFDDNDICAETMACIEALQSYYDKQDKVYTTLESLRSSLRDISVGREIEANRRRTVDVEEIIKAICNVTGPEYEDAIREAIEATSKDVVIYKGE